MKTKKLNCPYCDAAIDVNIEGRSSVFCNYCGQQIMLDDEKQEYTYNKNVTVNKNININKSVHNRYTDDADVIRAQNEAVSEKRFWSGWAIMMVGSLLMLALIGIIPELRDTINENTGKISAGDYLDLIGEDYKTVEAHFRAAEYCLFRFSAKFC